MPIKGQVLITPKRKYKIYSIVIKNKHLDELQQKYILLELVNLKFSLQGDGITEIRIAHKGHFIDVLSKGRL